MFHVARPGFPVGHIIHPGTWGARTREFAPAGLSVEPHQNAINVIWETALEAVRLNMPEPPVSRLDCVFACRNEAEARQYRDRFRGGSAIYEIKLVNGNTPISTGDYSRITNTAPVAQPHVDRIALEAMRYWTTEKPEFTELLIGGAVRISAIIDAGTP